MINKKISSLQTLSLLCLCCCVTSLWAVGNSSLVVKRDERRTVLENEYGEISAVQIGDGSQNGSFNLHFFKLEPNALFLPVMLHAEMLLYCHSGNGDLTWIDQGKGSATMSLSKGDVYRLKQGSVFFIRSNLGTVQRERLRITALFANSNEDLYSRFSPMGPYSSIADLVKGFDSSVLQAAFQVQEEVIQTMKNATKQPLIIQDVPSQPEEGKLWDWEGRYMRVSLRLDGSKMENKKKKEKKKDKDKESKTFNIYTADRDFENCNGWSLTVTPNDFEVLKDSNFGAFYVNLTKGAMMAPHWNPMATEIAFVVAGQGMVRIVCSSSVGNQSGCENQSFRVEEGDVFVVPRFHPMSQTSFNNGSFVFMGFSTMGTRNYPQYLVGKQSVFQVIGKDVLAAAFNVDNETVVQLSGQQQESLIVECTSCAEEQFSVWQEEKRKRREEEEARRREEEEERWKREEEERRREEEAAREEEERRKREEEKRQREEEARREEEERAEHERRQREEEERAEQERRQREEEERAEQERRQREEEERAERERRQREEEVRRQEEERERQRQEEEEGRGPGGGGESEEEAARREEEERERREREEQEGGGGHGGGGEAEEETPSREPEERQTRRRARPGRTQTEEEERGRQEESEGEAAMRQEQERIRREMGRSRSAEPPIIMVDNLEKVLDMLF
ncbi:hypothetical protein QQ045_011123 [Rhodiola kirilowii]